MIEVGQQHLDILIKNRESDVFNDWEQSFIKGLMSSESEYKDLSHREKMIVHRLISWWEKA